MKWFSKKSPTSKEVENWIRKKSGVRWNESSRAFAEKCVRACGKVFRRTFIQEFITESRQKKAEWETAQRNHERTTQELQTAEVDLRNIPPANWLWAMLTLACAVIGLTAEYVFTYETLPFLLDIPQGDPLAFFIAAAPVASVVMLDTVIWRLIEEPWRGARNSNIENQAKWRYVSITVMVLFLISCATILLYCIGLLAETREEVQKYQQQYAFDTPTLDEDLLAATIFWISIGVMVTSAWYLLQGMLEYCQAKKWSKARRTVKRLRSNLQRAEEKLASTTNEMEEYQIRARTLSQEADEVQEAFELMRLGELLNSQTKPSSAKVLVDDYLQSGPVIQLTGPT